jgi:hypothetical protein
VYGQMIFVDGGYEAARRTRPDWEPVGARL